MINPFCGRKSKRSAVRALSEAGYRIIGCDMNQYTPVSSLLYKFYKAPSALDEKDYIPFINDIIVRERIEYVVPISEPEIKLLNVRREDLRQLGIKLVLNNEVIKTT